MISREAKKNLYRGKPKREFNTKYEKTKELKLQQNQINNIKMNFQS